jgi:molybdopterin molybdotransferase
MKTLISPSEALRCLLDKLPAMPMIDCPLAKSTGRVLRGVVQADRPFPPFDRTMMDGYAIRAADLSESDIFDITQQIPAGSAAQLLGSARSTCAEIMTGAVMPSDADCVIPYEATKRLDAEQMQVLQPDQHTTGDFIHKLGSDRPAGATLLEAGRIIGSREIAVAASCGYTKLSVSKNPSIAVVSTGDELVDVVETPDAHQIRRSNDVMIESALWRAGLEANAIEHLPDDAEACFEQLKKLTAENDIVLLSGGVSMGKKDFIPGALDRLGLKCHFHGVAQKPGKPFGYWSDSKCSVFTLPGNPISTLVCLHHYVIPSLRQAMQPRRKPFSNQVEINEAISARDDFTLFLPVKIEESNTAIPMPVQNSGDLGRILDSDGYIVVEPTPEKSYAPGSHFEFCVWY